MPLPRLIALLAAVIAAAGLTVWIATLAAPGPGGLALAAILAVAAALLLRLGSLRR